MQAEEAPLIEASWESILNVALKVLGSWSMRTFEN